MMLTSNHMSKPKEMKQMNTTKKKADRTELILLFVTPKCSRYNLVACSFKWVVGRSAKHFRPLSLSSLCEVNSALTMDPIRGWCL